MKSSGLYDCFVPFWSREETNSPGVHPFKRNENVLSILSLEEKNGEVFSHIGRTGEVWERDGEIWGRYLQMTIDP